jgi:RNA polymerase sigma factor (sigma-70 family)
MAHRLALKPDVPHAGSSAAEYSNAWARGYFRIGVAMCSVMPDPSEERLRTQYADIYRYLRARTRKKWAAEDLTQQVFADAASYLKVGQAGELGLLYTIAKRRLVDELRCRGRDAPPLAEAEAVAAPADYGPELGRTVAEAIGRLDPGHRQIVGLKLLRGVSFAEAAAIVGVSKAACKMRLRRALEELRRELDQKGIGP